MLPSTLRSIVRDGRATVSGWSSYRHQTGRWPWFSIAIHTLNWVLMIAGMIFLLWCAGEYHLSRWQFAGFVVLVALPYGILWWWVKDRVKLGRYGTAASG